MEGVTVGIGVGEGGTVGSGINVAVGRCVRVGSSGGVPNGDVGVGARRVCEEHALSVTSKRIIYG
jgi:hypothetical protein